MKCKVIACKSLQRELCHLTALSPLELDFTFVEPGPSQSVPALQRQLEELRGQDCDGVILAMGLSLLEEELVNPLEVPLVLPRAHDTITLLLGSRARYRQVQEELDGSCYFYHSYSAQLGLLDTLNHSRKGREGICILTTPWEDPLETENGGRRLAACWGIPWVERAESLMLLTHLLGGDWREEETLLLRSGQGVQLSYREDILQRSR